MFSEFWRTLILELGQIPLRRIPCLKTSLWCIQIHVFQKFSCSTYNKYVARYFCQVFFDISALQAVCLPQCRNPRGNCKVNYSCHNVMLIQHNMLIPLLRLDLNLLTSPLTLVWTSPKACRVFPLVLYFFLLPTLRGLEAIWDILRYPKHREGTGWSQRVFDLKLVEGGVLPLSSGIISIPTWNNACSSTSPKIRRTWNCWSKSRGGCDAGKGTEGTIHMKTGWESCGFSSWRREGAWRLHSTLQHVRGA